MTGIDPATDALVVIDVQNDFCPGGRLAVDEGDRIIPGINALAGQFDHVVLSQDWHPAGHASFASTQGKDPYAEVQMPYGPQTLWPDHCVQGSDGAMFHPGLGPTVQRAFAVVRKGMNPDVDSYSAFFENDRTTPTGLAGLLRSRGIKRVFFVGLAYDFCVGFSALDARKEGFDAFVFKDLCRGIGIPLESGTTIQAMDARLQAAGVGLDASPMPAGPAPGPSVPRP